MDCVVRGLSTFSSGLLCAALLHCQNNNDGSGKTFVFATQSILLFSNSDGRDSTLQTTRILSPRRRLKTFATTFRNNIQVDSKQTKPFD